MPPTRFASIYLFVNVAVSACGTNHLMDVATESVEITAELEAGGLHQPLVLSKVLKGLGLDSMKNVRQLNEPEQLELAESLTAAGVNLGTRSKLRLLADGGAPAVCGHGDGSLTNSGAVDASALARRGRVCH